MASDRKDHYVWDVSSNRVVDIVILKKEIYKNIGSVIEVVALIALLIVMAAYVEPRFNF